mmetsp:Transcript_21573/g.66509  ORF Transcript_21573/g.66509 Transcript_21573/m.66509 type:complete len:171 (-) Transcript_21573:132-644(-)
MLAASLFVLLPTVVQSFVPTTVQRGRGRAVEFLSPEMSGWLAKTFSAEQYEKVVAETMRREDCGRAEAERKYNQYLFDPNGYALVKMQQQLEEEGFDNFKDAFVAKQGQEAWDARIKEQDALKEQRKNNSYVIVAAAFAAFVGLQEFLNAPAPDVAVATASLLSHQAAAV